MLATIVDTSALWHTVVGALVAGIGTTFVFSLAILGAARFAEASRDGKSAEATLFGLLAVAGVLATGAAIAVGVIVMTAK